jgi:hypothetical protein
MTWSRLLPSCCLVVCLASPAAAQGFISPLVATTVTSPSAVGSATKPGFGIAIGGVGGFFGGETEVAYYPEMMDNAANALSQNKVVTISGSTLLGPKIGPVKVYGAFGAGDLYLNVTSASSIVVPNPQSVSNNYVTINAGGGAMAFLGAHLGVRGDARYYKAYGFKATDVQAGTFTLNRFDFWRIAGELVVRF